MKLLLVFVLTTFIQGAAFGAASKESVQELITIAQIDKVTQMAFGPIVENLNNSIELYKSNFLANNKTNNSQKALLVKRLNDVKETMKEDLSWKNQEPMYTRIYSENLTQEEVDGVIAFYKSPAGQSWLKKTPLIFEKAKQEGEVMMLSLTQKVQNSIKTLETDLTKLDVK
jgi:hypothetical protein